MSNLTRILARRGVIYSIILSGIVALITINFWGWFFVRSFQDRILRQLQQQLRQSIPLHARQIGNEYFSQNDATLNTLDWQVPLLQSRLYEIKTETDAQNIYLVSLDQQQFFSDLLPNSSQKDFGHLPLNDSLFTLATIGITPEPELLTFAGEYFLTAYAAVSDGFGDPVAILVIEAPAELFSTVVFIRQALVYVGVAGLIIIAAFAALVVLAVRQLFRTEAELNSQASLAQLGQMAAMVAHEIRNPLSIIKGSADVLKKKYRSSEDELFDFIPAEIDRLNRLVSDFLQFARRKDLQTSAVNLDQELTQIVRQINDSRIDLQNQNSASAVKVDPDAFRQIMLNVIENARAAIPSDGRISIQTAGKKNYVIEIRDNGLGMNEEQLSKIFDPFYTTKATGSGLGMAITRRLIHQMQGDIKVESREGDGTTVRISLPFTARPAPPETP